MAKTSDLDMLIKILGMTTSDSDNQALIAMRKANALVTKHFGDWQTLLLSKVNIIEDPFKSFSPPPPKEATRNRPEPYTPRPQPTPMGASGGYKPQRSQQTYSPPPYSPPPPPPPSYPGMTAFHSKYTYHVRDGLKQLGAQWDNPSRTWYVPDARMPDALDLVKDYQAKNPPKAKRGQRMEGSTLEDIAADLGDTPF